MLNSTQLDFKLISTLSSDTKFTDEQRWIFGLIKNTEEDTHPNAHACRLRLALLAQACKEKLPWDVEKDKTG